MMPSARESETPSDAPGNELDLVFALDDEQSDVSAFDAEGASDDTTVGAWNDVLEAFESYCARGFSGDGFDVDELLREFLIDPTPMGEEKAKKSASDDGAASSRAREAAARAIRKHIANALRDSTRVAESDDEREMTRREAKDVPTAIKYIRARVNGKVRSLRAAGKSKPEMNRWVILRDIFVADLRSFGERMREFETLAGYVLPPPDLNLPDARSLVQKKIKETLEDVLDKFDESFDHLAAVVKRSKALKSNSRASSGTSKEASSDTRVERSNHGQGRHKKYARQVLAAWLWDHFYPTDERLTPIPTRAEKEALANQTGLTVTQVGDWFVNARARLWKPYIEGLIRGVYDDSTVKKALDLRVNASAA